MSRRCLDPGSVNHFVGCLRHVLVKGGGRAASHIRVPKTTASGAALPHSSMALQMGQRPGALGVGGEYDAEAPLSPLGNDAEERRKV